MSSELTHVGPLDDAPEREDTAPKTSEDARPRRCLARRAAVVLGLPMLVSAAVVTILVLTRQTDVRDQRRHDAQRDRQRRLHRASQLVVRRRARDLRARDARRLRRCCRGLPWYGITLYVLQAIGWAAIGVVAFTLRRRPALPERIVIIVTMLVLAPWMILRVSFTPTSLLLGMAGILVFAASANVRGHVGTAYAIAGGALLGAVFLIRFQSMYGIVIAFAPVLAFIVFKAGWRRTAVFGLVVGMFVLVGFGTNKIEYGRSAEWRAFMVTNSARSSLHATPRVSDKHVTRKDLDQIGWSQNDLKMFADFFYPDKRVYSPKAIKTLAQLSPRVADTERTSKIYDRLRSPFVAIPLFVAGLLALRRSRSAALLTLATAIWLAAVLVALLLYIRLPNRVLIPMEGAAAFIVAIVPTYVTSLSPRAATRPEMVLDLRDRGRRGVAREHRVGRDSQPDHDRPRQRPRAGQAEQGVRRV